MLEKTDEGWYLRYGPDRAWSIWGSTFDELIRQIELRLEESLEGD
jgi:hypothetical protein